MSGWLGTDQTAEDWIRTAHSEDRVDCHKHHPGQCAGLAIYRTNVCKRPRDPETLVLPADRATVFASREEFLTHHNKLGHTSADLKYGRRD